MKIYKTIEEFQLWRKSQTNKTVGFVPTMGALHKGHLSLIQKTKKQCDITVVSIFVNQLQFAPNEDFNQYPRTLKEDLNCLNNQKTDVLFLPSATEMYNENFNSKIREYKMSKKLEGKSRPNFFNGVMTIVSKLFNIVKPTHAFFGEKDIQQLYIIKKMVKDLDYNIIIYSCPTIRNKLGLALSSRNQYLSATEKKQATILYDALRLGKGLIQKGENYMFIHQEMINKIKSFSNIKIDYLSIASLESFEELKNNLLKTNIVISGAIYINKIRLIDNIIILKNE